MRMRYNKLLLSYFIISTTRFHERNWSLAINYAKVSGIDNRKPQKPLLVIIESPFKIDRDSRRLKNL